MPKDIQRASRVIRVFILGARRAQGMKARSQRAGYGKPVRPRMFSAAAQRFRRALFHGGQVGELKYPARAGEASCQRGHGEAQIQGGQQTAGGKRCAQCVLFQRKTHVRAAR